MLEVVTWNVNSVQARLDRVLPFLKSEDPDIVCLQELKCTTEKFPKEVFQNLGYHSAVYGQKTYNGVAILSKVPLSKVETGFGDDKEDPAARFIAATVGKIRVLCAYVPNGQEVGSDKYRYKLQWLSRLKAYLQDRFTKSSKYILCGDFNVAPTPLDVHDPKLWEGKILFSEKEREAFDQLITCGLGDTFRWHHGEGGHYSWWDYRQLAFVKDRGLRIDFVLASLALKSQCVHAQIFRAERKGTKPSDHAPVSAAFDL